MLIFLCPLQSRESAKNWKQVLGLCRATIKSICAQTNKNFKVFLICNEDPGIGTNLPHVEVLTGAFPAPKTQHERMLDKYAKLNLGAYAARSLAPSHFMKVDADDRVSNRLAQLVSDNPNSNGWFFEKGYLHQQNSRFVYLQSRFHTICGTSAIIRCTEEDLPSSASRDESRFSLIHLGHHLTVESMRELNRPLEPLPFPGAMYEIGTGENWTGISYKSWPGFSAFLKRSMAIRFKTKKICDEFS